MQLLSKYHKRTLLVLILMCLLFLVLQPGVWAYLDASYQLSMSHNIARFRQSVFDVTGYGYNGDGIQLVAGRYVQIAIEILLKNAFGLKWGIILVYIVYFVVNYFLTKSILSTFVSKKYSFIGALLYTFNPLSIYMMDQIGFLYVYSSVPMLLYGLYNYFYNEKNTFLYLFLICLGTIFLTSYTRFTLIYIIFFIVLLGFYYKEALSLLLKQSRKCILLVTLVLVTNIPFIFSFVYPNYAGEKEYFGGISNYTDAFKARGPAAYNGIKSAPLAGLLVPTEPSGNFGSGLSNNPWFIYFSLAYFIFTMYFLVFKQLHLSKKEKKIFSFAVSIVTFGVVCRLLPYYFSSDTFVHISYDLLPFLANNSAFAYRFMLAGFSLLIPLSLQHMPRRLGNIILLGGLVYCFWTASILLLFHSNQKLHTVNIEKNDPIYNVYATKSTSPSFTYFKGSLIFPSYYLLFDRTPYPISLDYIPGLLPGVAGNERTGTPKQINFSRYLSQSSILNHHLENLGVFTLGSFLVMQHINDDTHGVYFDFYPVSNYSEQAVSADGSLSNNSGVTLVEENILYKRYDIQDIDLFSFFIYLPGSIVLVTGYENILDTGINLIDRPFFVDNASYHRPLYISSGYIIPNTSGQTLDIKTRQENQFVYYLKIGNVQSGQDILLQFNKTFGESRKIKYIDKDTYDAVSCNDYHYYPISHNTICYRESIVPPIREFFDVLQSEPLANIDHFEGNIIGNTRVLTNINNVDENGNIYIIVSHDKQYLFTITQGLAIFTLLLIGIIGTISFIKKGIIGKDY